MFLRFTDTVLGFELSNLCGRLITIHDRHVKVHQDNIKHLFHLEVFFHLLTGFLAIVPNLKVYSLLLKQVFDNFDHKLAVLDNQHDLPAYWFI
jgi:hypothetical protein